MKKLLIILIAIILIAGSLLGIRYARKALREKRINQNTTQQKNETNSYGNVNAVAPTGGIAKPTAPVTNVICPGNGATKSTHAYKTVAGVDPNLLSLDVYVPKVAADCKTKSPVMIYVHGGGWQIGDKAGQIKNKSTYFPNKGYVFVSVNYRLAPAVMYPVFNQDVAAAVKYVYDNADKFNADTNQITIMGHSAGGGIISAVSTDEKYLNNVGLPLSTLKCALSIDTEGYNISDKAGENTRVYEAPFGSDEKLWAEASPINHISSGKGIPSFFIATRGNKERVSRAKTFQQKLTQANILTSLIEAPSLDHEGINAAIGDPNDTIVTPPLQKFLDENCK